MTGDDFDPDESFELALFRAAEAQNEAGHHFLAVVTAQAAVEAVAQTVFTTLFSINLPRSLVTMNELLPDRSFMAKGTNALRARGARTPTWPPRRRRGMTLSWRPACATSAVTGSASGDHAHGMPDRPTSPPVRSAVNGRSRCPVNAGSSLRVTVPMDS
jgi:hypothetical protein